KVMDEILTAVRQVARTDTTVLLTGETGTGKGLIAQTIHRLSDRKNKPFVHIDCSAITPNLIENELFGHAKGAYTGADEANPGRILQAHGGTIFLDEISELPLNAQAKFLTFVQERYIIPVGSTKLTPVNARVIAASNRDLENFVREKRFRSDLFFRLNVIHFELPSLRKRKEDIYQLALFFCERFSLQHQKPFSGITPKALEVLNNRPRSGNVRELQNMMMRAILFSDDGWITP
ncbi:uncharacterized protein METZ01_LOCUS500772, partial [marine metagenome]